MTEVEQLKARVRRLEQELADRERDLTEFREELIKANSKIEAFLTHMSHELRVMNTIQKVLVPTAMANIPGFDFSTKFVPGRTNGGDYFDIFEHEDKFRFGVVLSHASGYSASALLLSVLLKLTGQMEARRGTPPAEVIASLSAQVHPHLQTADSVHVFYGVIDRRTFEFTYSSLGRNVGLHCVHAEGKVKRLENGAEPLTTDTAEKALQHTLYLNPSDRLILCSEGLLQVQNSKGERFGEQGLYRAVLSAPKVGVHELRNEILYQAHKFAGGQEPEQDLTVIVLEVKDRVIKLA